MVRCLDLKGSIHLLKGDNEAARGAFTAGLKRAGDEEPVL
jgi:hypothetical protein